MPWNANGGEWDVDGADDDVDNDDDAPIQFTIFYDDNDTMLVVDAMLMLTFDVDFISTSYKYWWCPINSFTVIMGFYLL